MATIEELLSKLDLSKFVEKFKAEDIDLEAAKALNEDELKDLGLTLGARKKLYQALHPGGTAVGATAPATSAPAAAVPPAATAKPAGPKVHNDIKAVAWRWMHNAEWWPGNAGGLTGGAGIKVRMVDGDEPTECYTCRVGYGDINNPINIWDIESGQVLRVLKNKDGATVGADSMGNLMAQVGESFSFAVWNAAEGKVLHSSHTPSGEGLMFCSLIKGASGAPQLAATSYYGRQAYVWDVGTGELVSKFKMLENAYGVDMLRDPFNPATFLFVVHGKTRIFDVRAKGEARALVTLGDGYDMHLPANSGGKLIAHSGGYASVVDYGTGKLMHKIYGNDERKGQFQAIALCGNAVAAFLDLSDDTGYHFYDLNGGPAEIVESQHNLRKSHHWAHSLDMSSKYVVAMGSAAYSMKNGN